MAAATSEVWCWGTREPRLPGMRRTTELRTSDTSTGKASRLTSFSVRTGQSRDGSVSEPSYLAGQM